MGEPREHLGHVVDEALRGFPGLLEYFDLDGRDGCYPTHVGETYGKQTMRLRDLYRRWSEDEDWRIGRAWFTLRSDPFTIGSWAGASAHHVLLSMLEAFLWCFWRCLVPGDVLFHCDSPRDFPEPDENAVYNAEWGPIAERVREAGLRAGDLDYLLPALRQEAARLDLADKTDNKTDKKKKNVPADAEVLRLARLMKRELPKGRMKKEISLEFCDGNARKAERLLRQLRRYPDLLG